jgi:hypothetical protein
MKCSKCGEWIFGPWSDHPCNRRGTGPRSYANGNGQSTYNGPGSPWGCYPNPNGPDSHWWTLGSWPA